MCHLLTYLGQDFDVLSVCKLILMEFLQFSPNLRHIATHGLSFLTLHFDGIYLRSYQDLACLTLISDCRCDIAYFKCRNNFFTRGCKRSLKKCLTPILCLKHASNKSYHLNFENIYDIFFMQILSEKSAT